MAEKEAVATSTHRSTDLSVLGFLGRFIASLVLVMATYNPTKFSFWGWVNTARLESNLGPEHFVVGVILVIGWVVLLTATQRSLGFLGLLLGGALLGGLVWLMVDLGWLNLNSVSAATWVGLVCLALLLAIGLSWSHVWRKLTGQLEVDED